MTTKHGAYFARLTSDYGDVYEKTAFSLKVGGVSDVIEANGGYYVIVRLAPEEDWILRNFDDFASDVIAGILVGILAGVLGTLLARVLPSGFYGSPWPFGRRRKAGGKHCSA